MSYINRKESVFKCFVFKFCFSIIAFCTYLVPINAGFFLALFFLLLLGMLIGVDQRLQSWTLNCRLSWYWEPFRFNNVAAEFTFTIAALCTPTNNIVKGKGLQDCLNFSEKNEKIKGLLFSLTLLICKLIHLKLASLSYWIIC